jgi:hypothetical protein
VLKGAGEEVFPEMRRFFEDQADSLPGDEDNGGKAGCEKQGKRGRVAKG